MRNDFLELAALPISPKRSLIISRKTYDGEDKLVLAQKLLLEDEEGRDINFFVKGSISIPLTKLRAFRDILDRIIQEN